MHVQTVHGVTDPHSCFLCESIFPSSDSLSLHMKTDHPYTQPSYFHHYEVHPEHNSTSFPNFPTSIIKTVHCNSCAATFTDMRLLNIHTIEYHRGRPSTPLGSSDECVDGDTIQSDNCKECDNTFESMEEITTHLAIEHEAEPDSSSPELTRIPQVDGILDELDVITSPNSVIPASSMNNPGASSVPTTSFSVLHVPYQLNQHKQITKLARDSTIDNIEITVNDNNRNVNIVCSTGFYEAVAKPALSSMSTSYSHSVLGVSILCTVFRKTQDQNMSQPGLFMRFELSGPDVEPNPAPLSVHLHNTQRKVQLQGGGLMPDKSRAPVWFLENILKNIFTDQAKRKKINIDQINRKILSEIAKLRLPPTQSTCSHCKKKFNAVSKPTTCHKCSLLKHSTKCSPCPMLSSPSTTRALAMQSVAIPGRVKG